MKIQTKIIFLLGVIAIMQTVIQLYFVNDNAFSGLQSFFQFFAVNITMLTLVLVLVHWMILVPLMRLNKIARGIAQGEGDLTQRVPVTGTDEIDELGQSVNLFIDKLQHSLRRLGEVTGQVASSSNQMTMTAEQMASGASTQSARVTQSAAAVEEMSRTAGEVARNSQEAASLATHTTHTAEEGYGVVTKTIQGMQEVSHAVEESEKIISELGHSSDQIGKIVQVIEEIADQTNLLALNAAIEAARAGEQGRGFAVVADEVRKLAERTTRATKEIGDMIRNIQQDTKNAVASMKDGTSKVHHGVELAQKTGAALNSIQTMVLQTADMIQQIACAAEEQSSATKQIASDLEAVSQVSLETTNGANQSAVASKDLSQLATALQSIVSSFKIN